MATTQQGGGSPAAALQAAFKGQEVVVFGHLSRLEVNTSTTHAAFPTHKVGPAPPSPTPPPRAPVPFAGRSSYKDDFAAKPLPPPPAPYSPPPRAPLPFEGRSTTHATFVGHAIQPAPASPPPPPRQHIPFQGSSSTHESYRGHAVAPRRASLGIATLGDRYHVLIPGAAPAPTSASQVFTTVHDGQRHVCFLVLQGDAPLARDNRLLGQFQLGPLPPAPAGTLRIQVTFFLDEAGSLSAEAQDAQSGQYYEWRLQQQE